MSDGMSRLRLRDRDTSAVSEHEIIDEKARNQVTQLDTALRSLVDDSINTLRQQLELEIVSKISQLSYDLSGRHLDLSSITGLSDAINRSNQATDRANFAADRAEATIAQMDIDPEDNSRHAVSSGGTKRYVDSSVKVVSDSIKTQQSQVLPVSRGGTGVTALSNTPTSGSSAPITSDGVAGALAHRLEVRHVKSLDSLPAGQEPFLAVLDDMSVWLVDGTGTGNPVSSSDLVTSLFSGSKSNNSSVTDLNKAPLGLVAYVEGTANTPGSNDLWGLCITVAGDIHRTWVWQIALGTTNDLYWRHNINKSGWSRWVSFRVGT